jgi:hypothetical protein
MKKLLSFRHWQLFLLIVIYGAWTSPSPLKEIINSVAVITLALWLYAIGIYGQDRIEELGLQPMNLKLFKVNVIGIAVLCAAALIYSLSQGGVNEANRVIANTVGPKDLIFILASLYAVFALFQTIIFASKTIAKLEYRREVTFNDYFNNLLLFCFFFIGVWFLQPKVNRLIAPEEEVAF